jgi:hypothetical protein
MKSIKFARRAQKARLITTASFISDTKVSGPRNSFCLPMLLPIIMIDSAMILGHADEKEVALKKNGLQSLTTAVPPGWQFGGTEREAQQW